MVPTQTLENFPVFGNNATKVKPEEQKYSNGFMPADVYPAEWVNYVWNKASSGVTLLNEGVNMMEQEINNVLDGADKTPDATKNNQLLEAIQKLITDAETRAKLAAHPIGSLYWSKNSTDPSTLFGGTWARVKDKFILAAGDTYAQGATGGAATVTLDTTKIPSHNHTFTGSEVTSGGSSAANTGAESSHTHSVGAHSHGLNSHTHSVTAAGTVSKHSHTMAHTHSVTAGGTVSVSTNPTFTGSSVSTGAGGLHSHFICAYNARVTSKPWYDAQSWVSAKRVAVGNSSWSSPSINNKTQFDFTDKNQNTNVSKRIRFNTSTWDDSGTGTYDLATDAVDAHTHTVTAKGTISGGAYSFSGSAVTSGGSSAANTGETQPTFSGTAVTSGGASGNTANSTAFNSGTGSSHSHTMAHTHSVTAAGNIGNTGGGGAHENMPPYVAYYCWERVS